ncbi:MAG: ABC transporter substrate-binding protein [Flavobacteriaceae bacterium]|nr:ABC transporter substrate-binding protein [Bacteroidia bacterium]NNL60378.1 ABC transporter substrate-binding protein [Flavobacteriaceae bacterium]
MLCLALILILSCKRSQDPKISDPVSNDSSLELTYAEGFSVINKDEYRTLTIANPWPNSDRTFVYALVDRKVAPKISLMSEQYDGIIVTPVASIVVTSTTHIPSLELLDVHDKLIGFPGTDYISSLSTRRRIEDGKVHELGKNEGINTEVLLNIKPEVVIGFGVESANKTYNVIQNANIPVIYNGDWTESSALAKAEWIKFFGVLFDKEQEADSIFKSIELNYLKAKQIALEVKTKPSILSGAMHKDVWYLPNGSSGEAQLLKDANTNYLWSDTDGAGSLALSFESVFEKAKDADLWFSPSYYTSLEQLEKANPHYTKFKAFKDKKVYSFSLTKGETGGVLYYEQGMSRPDLVLKDIIKICHPELLTKYDTYFFKQLK